MKRIFIVGILFCCFLLGCANQSNSAEEEMVMKGESSVEETQTSNQPEAEYIGLFEKAEYEKYNSYASENGLKDTLIYIEGKVLNQTKFDLDEATMPLLALVVEQQDGNRWSVSVPSDSKIDEIQDKNVRVFGTYMGFSDVMNLPSMDVVSDNLDIMDEIRIEIEENGEYVTFWKFSDFIWENLDDIIGSSETSSEKNESMTEESLPAGDGNTTEEPLPQETENIPEETLPAESKSVPEESSQESSQIYTPTTGEKNALRTAKRYLEIMPFSYKGLIEQLEFEKYLHDEAVYAVDNCGADWNEQAAKKAKSYLEIMSFSKDALIEQLEFEGFTHDQAVYGVEANGY